MLAFIYAAKAFMLDLESVKWSSKIERHWQDSNSVTLHLWFPIDTRESGSYPARR